MTGLDRAGMTRMHMDRIASTGIRQSVSDYITTGEVDTASNQTTLAVTSLGRLGVTGTKPQGL